MSESARTATQITDDDCIVRQLGYTATIRFHNVIKDQFNVYVHVNGTQVITEPGNTALAGPFTLDLQDGDNVVRVRLASKTGTHFSERYGSDRFHYKVKATDVLVSNIGQADSISTAFINNTVWRAQLFTTGPNEGGYSVSKIVVNFRADVSGTFTFAVHETDSTGTTVVPGTKVADLTGAPTSSGEHSFTPSSAPMLLDASNGLFHRFREEHQLRTRTFSGPTPVVKTRGLWTVGASAMARCSHPTRAARGTTQTAILEIAVKGELRAVSSDATLSALALRDASDNAVALEPGTFASGTTSYNATVANSVSQIKVEPTANDSDADIKYLDDGDATLPDADTSTAVFDFVLAEGGERRQGQGDRREDGTTTETYTVTVNRRVDFLVSNLDGHDFENWSPISGNTRLVRCSDAVHHGQRDLAGYTLISEVVAPNSRQFPLEPLRECRSTHDSSGQPGSVPQRCLGTKIVHLSGYQPRVPANLSFGADSATKLEPSDMSIWIVVQIRASGERHS